MKKVIVYCIALGFALLMAACEPAVEVDKDELNCPTGYIIQEDTCVMVMDETDDDNDNDDEEVVLPGPIYQSNVLPVYEGRDITSDECAHLDNIGQWQPVWCDEFDYEGLPDNTKWGYDVGGHGWGNNELQYYTESDIDNAYVGNGYLTIEAMKESMGGRDYTSARLISKNKGDWTYGKIQVRAKVPGGKGTWPAIWMLPTDWVYGGWPDSGEIDIMEYVGVDPDILHGTIHTGAFNHMLGTQKGKSIDLENMDTLFHVYEIEWEPNVIRYYVNGIKYYEVNYDPFDSTTATPWQAWPFDQDFHLLINVAFGGNWGGYAGVDSTLDNMKFEIDYVRVYQKDYAGMDNDAPGAVSNIDVVSSTASQTIIGWDQASDDVMVKHYEVYLDDVLVETSAHNGVVVDSSDQERTLKVIAVDFAGHEGEAVTYTIPAFQNPTEVDRIEAEHYTSMVGIQLESTSDTGGGMNAGYIDAGDYLEYTIEITKAATYSITARVASQDAGGSFDILVDDVKVTDISFDATGGWQNWIDTTSDSFTLTPGIYTFKIEATSPSWNINYFEFNEVN